ncbi:M56 family peptidase [Actinocorallia longicatena]|uniref:M56 family metallopeptidase n=1 Tax=Actinocorallia longicatena TaxID=111803 RepID=A0ABP6Q260_9ACTN
MIWLTFLPAGITLALGVLLGRVGLPLHPVWTARVLCTVAAMTVPAAAGTLGFVAVNFWATLEPAAAGRMPEWALFGDDEPVPVPLGVAAIVLLVAGLCVTLRLASRWVAEVRSAQDLAQSLLESDVPMAVSVPGRRGGVLASRGLYQVLGAAELEVVFHHEASHLRHGHHRYLAAGSLAAGLLPPLRRLNGRMRFSLERWADEDAAEAVADRELVALTIARVALLQPSGEPGPLPAFADSGILRRVEALMARAPGRNPVTGPVSLLGTGLVTGALALTALQIDHAFTHAFL